ncbi:MAG: HNH endonuclease signature motif containing protein [Alphaproteobacteria bacterium]
MKKIYTAKGESIDVDDDLYESLNKFKWHIHQGYACRSAKVENGSRKIRMHREVLGLGWGKQGSNAKVVDHIDRNKLNNTRENLRIVTKQENEWNRHAYSSSTTGYPGVRFRKDSPDNPFQSVIKVNGVDKCLGSFPSAEKAYIAYLEAKIFYHLKRLVN